VTDVVEGDDGLARCAWGTSAPEYVRYHDEEWGRPVGDDNRVLEKLCLEGFQSGLSWLTILRKREGFRRAFASFEPARVAAFDDSDVERLLQDAAIVRHRGKIVAAIGNARATLAMREQGISLAGLLWQHEPPRHDQPTGALGDVPASTPESKALSAALRKHGFRFVGPTTVYAAMQSLGVVNDHLQGCHFGAASAADRARFTPPAAQVGAS
jgi:DNA-3-methyladenine glycosylase I